jgi:hypothetical protein
VATEADRDLYLLAQTRQIDHRLGSGGFPLYQEGDSLHQNIIDAPLEPEQGAKCYVISVLELFATRKVG